jgi:hypothetical protein
MCQHDNAHDKWLYMFSHTPKSSQNNLHTLVSFVLNGTPFRAYMERVAILFHERTSKFTMSAVLNSSIC